MVKVQGVREIICSLFIWLGYHRALTETAEIHLDRASGYPQLSVSQMTQVSRCNVSFQFLWKSIIVENKSSNRVKTLQVNIITVAYMLFEYMYVSRGA